MTYGSESESYITTDGQSASLCWNKAPVWGSRPDFYYYQTIWVCWCGALSLTRGWVCRLQLLLALASAVIFGSESRGTRDHILLSQIRNFFSSPSATRTRYSTPPPHLSPLYNFGANQIQITTFNSSPIIPCPSVAAETCLPSRCLAMEVSAMFLWLHTSVVSHYIQDVIRI
jgi:hypothetical protein